MLIEPSSTVGLNTLVTVLNKLNADFYCENSQDKKRVEQILNQYSLVQKVLSPDELGAVDQYCVLIGMFFEFSNTRTHPPRNFKGELIWFLPNQADMLVETLSLFRDSNVKYVLANFFPDEYDEKDFGDLSNWFNSRWIFWSEGWKPCEERFSENQKISTNPCSGTIEDTEGSELVALFGEWIQTCKSGKIQRHASSTQFLSEFYSSETLLWSSAEPRSSLLHFLFSEAICFFSSDRSIRMMCRDMLSKTTVQTPRILIDLSRLIHVGFFDDFVSYTSGKRQKNCIISCLNKVFGKKQLYAKKVKPLRVEGQLNEDIGKWFVEYRSRETIDVVLDIIGEDDLWFKERLLRKYALAFLSLDIFFEGQKYWCESLFRLAYLQHKNWLTRCVEATTYARENYRNCRYLNTKFSQYVVASLLHKDLGKESDPCLMEFCTNMDHQSLSRTTPTGMGTVLRENSSIEAILSCALNTFNCRKFDEAESIFKEVKCSDIRPEIYRWEYLATKVLCGRMDEAKDLMCNVFREDSNLLGLGSSISHNLFFSFPELFFGQDGSITKNENWGILFELIQFDVDHRRKNILSEDYYLIFATLFSPNNPSTFGQQLIESKYGRNAWTIFYAWLAGNKWEAKNFDFGSFFENDSIPVRKQELILGAVLNGEEQMYEECISRVKMRYDCLIPHITIQQGLGVILNASNKSAYLAEWSIAFKGNRFYHPLQKAIVERKIRNHFNQNLFEKLLGRIF